MEIEQKRNKIFRTQSVYTFSAEEINQVSAELQNVITEGGLVPSASDTTQVKTAIRNMIGTGGDFIPDYSAGITISTTTYTAPTDGMISTFGRIESITITEEIKINGITVSEFYSWEGNWAGTSNQITFFVSQGDVISNLNRSGKIFFPLKGVSND